MEKKKVIFVIILVNILVSLYSISYAGLYYIEVPYNITDDMFFSKIQTNLLKNIPLSFIH